MEYWDLTNIYFPKLEFNDEIILPYVIKINSFSDLINRLNCTNKQSTIFVPHITYNYQVIRLFYLFTRQRCVLAYFARGALPNPVVSSVHGRVFQALLNFDRARMVRGVLNKIAHIIKQYGYVKHYDILFTAGSRGYVTTGRCAEVDLMKSRIININSSDVEKYKSSRINARIFANKYIVFLDQYLPFHPDMKICGITNIDSMKYYKSINGFFRRIERDTGLQVVIAAHPKSAGYRSKNYYENRLVISDKTLELVDHSEFVIAHNSTSISFAILAQKPIVFITSQELKAHMRGFHDAICTMSTQLNSPLMAYDTPCINLPDIKVDNNAYAAYINNYLSSNGVYCSATEDIYIGTLLSL